MYLHATDLRIAQGNSFSRTIANLFPLATTLLLCLTFVLPAKADPPLPPCEVTTCPAVTCMNIDILDTIFQSMDSTVVDMTFSTLNWFNTIPDAGVDQILIIPTFVSKVQVDIIEVEAPAGWEVTLFTQDTVIFSATGAPIPEVGLCDPCAAGPLGSCGNMVSGFRLRIGDIEDGDTFSAQWRHLSGGVDNGDNMNFGSLSWQVLTTGLVPEICNAPFAACWMVGPGFDCREFSIVLNDFNDWCSHDRMYSNTNATPDGTAGSCWGGGPACNVWFSFVAPSEFIKVDLLTGGSEGTLKWPLLALWDTLNNEIDCDRYSSKFSDLCVQSEALVPGQTYFISVDVFSGGSLGKSHGTFSLCITENKDYDYREAPDTIPDLNDWCSLDEAYTTACATPDQSAGSCWLDGPNYNRWFTFTATGTYARVTLQTGGTKGTLSWPYIALLDTSLNEIDCDFYYSKDGELNVNSNSLTPGEPYLVMVDNYGSEAATGTFTLCATDVMDYDYEGGAIAIATPGAYSSALGEFSTIGASPDESAASCWYEGPNYNRWFRFVAPGNDITVELKTGDTEGTMKWPYLALYDAGGTELACQQYTGKYNDLIVSSNMLTPGNTYFIAVDHFGSRNARGTFSLCTADTLTVLKDGNGAGPPPVLSEQPEYLNVFPNPVRERLFIALEGGTALPNPHLMLTDITGRPVLTEQRAELLPGQLLQLNIGHLPYGAYVLSVRCEDGQQFYRTVIHR